MTTSRIPVVRQTSWLMVIPQLIVMLSLIVLVEIIFRPEPFILSGAYGAGLYLLYSYGSRWLLLKLHRQGMQLTRQEKYQEAANKFDASYQFFTDHAWIDKYRSLTMMIPAAISYREMALINSGYCYVQLGDSAKAKMYYQKALAEFPESAMAHAALKLLETAENQPEIKK